MENTDDLIKAMREDELQDKLEAARNSGDGPPVMMSVREYAKANGLEPQLLYYYIRTGKFDQMPCPCCGRKVIDVGVLDQFFRERARKATSLEATKQTPGSDLDT